MNKLVLLVALAASLIVLASALLIAGDKHGKPKGDVTIPVPGPAPDVVADRDNEMEPEQQDEALPDVIAPEGAPMKETDGLGFHEDTRDETPPGVSEEQLERGERITDRRADEVMVAPENPAGAQNYSCAQRFVVNNSALNGRIVGVMLHFTVSDPGSLDAIRRLFNTPSFGASSTFGYELFTNRCEQWVSLLRKSWAAGAANSSYWMIEIVSKDRTRASWLAAPAIRDGILAQLVADLLKQAGAPPRFVDPVGCIWPAGVTDHDHAECGNTHWDVGKNFPWDVFMAQVRRYYYGAGSAVRGTASQRAACRKLTWWRASREHGQARRNAVLRRKTLARRGLDCQAGKLVRR